MPLQQSLSNKRFILSETFCIKFKSQLKTKTFLPVSVGVPLVKVGLVPVVELSVDGIDHGKVSVSLGIHFIAHLGTLSSQKVSDFAGERRDASFTPAVVVFYST